MSEYHILVKEVDEKTKRVLWTKFYDVSPETLAVIEAVVSGATVITLDTVPRKWAVIAYEGIPVTDEDKPTPCPECEGRGIVPKRDSSGKFIQNETITCPSCYGKEVKP